MRETVLYFSTKVDFLNSQYRILLQFLPIIKLHFLPNKNEDYEKHAVLPVRTFSITYYF